MKKQKYRISFCVTCMGRLHHLRQTILKNIEDNLPYSNLEFIILNYNSKDGMDSWVKKELGVYIEKGIVKYLKTEEPKYWHASHAKNIAAKYSTGDIICNVDSDNIIGEGYAEYVNKNFIENVNTSFFLTGRTVEADVDSVGRICVRKNDFLRVNGYNENITGYGYEDVDLYRRLCDIGLKENFIDVKYLKTIEHENIERLKNTNISEEIEFVLFSELDKGYKAFVMKKTGEYEELTIIPDKKDKKDIEVTIDDSKTELGYWIENQDKIILKIKETVSDILKIPKMDDVYSYQGNHYIKACYEDKPDLFFMYTLLINQRVSKKVNESNEENNNTTIRRDFGNALVYVNFDDSPKF